MKNFAKLEIYCALGLIICFFLPWIQMGGVVSVVLKGYEIPDLADYLAKGIGQFKGLLDGNSNRESWVFWYYTFYLIPVFSVVTIILGLIGKNVKVTGILAAIVPIGWCIYALIKIGGDLFDILTFGAYLTLGCAVLMVLAVVDVLHIASKS